QQAQEAEIIDLSKEDDGAYAVKLREEARGTPAPEPVGAPDLDEANDPPMPASSAPPSMRPAQPQAGGGVPSRGARFRRDSRGRKSAVPTSKRPRSGHPRRSRPPCPPRLPRRRPPPSPKARASRSGRR